MRERLNADGHDESQYTKAVFNPKTCKMEMPPIVNAFRAQHGHIKRNSDDKLVDLTWLPAVLEDKGIIEKVHLDTCKSFLRVLIQAKRTLGVCELKGPLYDKAPEEIRNDADLYLLIKHGVSKQDLLNLIWLVEEKYTQGNVWAADAIIGNLLHALEAAQQIIFDNSEQSAKIAASTSPEVRPDFVTSPRPE